MYGEVTASQAAFLFSGLRHVISTFDLEYHRYAMHESK